MRARDTFPSRYDRISRFDDGESKLPQMETEDERIERSKWVGLRGYERASNREKLSRIARTLERLISEYRRGEDGEASKGGDSIRVR